MADMTIEQIYQLLAKKLETDLNTYSEYTKFTVKTSYNYQEPSEDLRTVNGVMNFANNNIAPIQNLEAYTLPASVSFVCKKEYANEVIAILTKHISKTKGLVQTIGDYDMLPTYSTPSQNEITMAGQIGESLPITIYIEYLVLNNILISNDMTVEIDGVSLVFDKFEFGKQKAADEDSIEDNETLQSVVKGQSLTFGFNCFVPIAFLSSLVDEILSLKKLEAEHTLTVKIKSFTYQYKVVMIQSAVSGVKGGVMYASLNFSISDGKNGGRQ